ncbi:MAG: DUF1553 domain-containing protein [Verrucomicrobiales bacterium]|nr:DUF1553 domain-containing protein [Verrucomicrobiales bacterium]
MRILFSIAFYSILTSQSLSLATDIDYARDVLPILSDKCFICHGPDKNTREADLRLDTADGAAADLGGYSALVPHKPDESELVLRIHDTEDPMPPRKSNLILSEAEKQTLRNWIQQGGEYSEHWSFIPPERPDIPTGEFGPNPIDAFIGSRLEKEGFDFNEEASPERLIRRLTLDLTGLPPTPEEVSSFVADYIARRDAAYEAAVDRLLASPRYGEAMALPWLEAARFADTDGYQFDGPRFQWRWRDWVIDAYNSHKPFDQFTIEQLAGDLLPNATLDQKIATGFNRNHRYNSEAGLVIEEFLLENAVDRVDTTSTLWMGLTMGCARCHDHKYDPISQKDYYQMIAFFNSIPEAGRAVKNGNSEPVIIAPTREQEKILNEKKSRVKTTRAALVPGNTPQNGGQLIDRKLETRYALDRPPTGKVQVAGTPEYREKALVLDGKSHLEIADQKLLPDFRADRQFTVSMWIRPNTTEDAVVLSRQKGGTTRPGIEVSLVDGGKLQFDLISRWVAGVGRVTTKESVPQDKWTHIAVTNDGSNSANGQHVFLNGELAAVTVTHNTNSNNGGVTEKEPLRIGFGIRPESKKFNGSLRDLRLYSTDLWKEEISLLAAPYGGEMRKQFSLVKNTAAYAEYVKAREELEAYEETLPTLMVMSESPHPKRTFLRNRGIYHDLGEEVQRDVPSKLPPLPDKAPRDRLGFARWLVSGEHPLTARVAVNRYWQKHFGTGLVKTAEDFGVQGEAPSHPELLDWLASEFVASGWDVAAMHKRIVTSRTYRQAARMTSDHRERDPENRLLARGPRIRLSGQVIRDQALYLSGLLHEQTGGPSVSPYQPANLWAEMSMGMKYKPSTGKDLYRRSLYTIWKRTVAPPTMAVFDAADREACWVNRKETNTPLQALALLNETGFVEAARHFAARILTEGGEAPLTYAFRAATARHPKENETAILEAALAQYRDEFARKPDEATKLLSIGASPPTSLHGKSPEELAAWTSLANVLLNLDETITRK